MISEDPAYGARLLQVQDPGQQVDHPAWSFGCAEADVAIRAVPCDEPVYVYGGPCQVGTGRPDQPKPCEATHAKREEKNSGGFSLLNPLAFFNK